MAGSINKVTLLGRLGADPKIANTTLGKKIATMSLATSDTWKDKTTGEKKERVEWHSVVIYNTSLVDIAERYLRKGSYVYIEGKIQSRKWTDSLEIERTKTEIVLQNFDGVLVMLDNKDSTPQILDDAPSADLDDDIPF